MRIFFIGAKGFPAATVPGGGGVERHVEEVAVRLAERGHQVFVYARDYTVDPRRKKFKGVHIIPLFSWRSKNIATISHVFLATMHVLSQRADIIHYHGIGPATLAWIPRLFKPRAKIIVTFHSRDRMDPKWSWFARAYLAFGEWAALSFPHQTIVVSHVLQIFCQKLYGRRTIYIPNGAEVHKKEGTSLLKLFDVMPNQYLLSVGRLVANKAYDVAMQAYKKVDSTMPFLIVGDAEYATAHVEHLAHLAAQDPRVHLVGHQDGKALHQLLAHCYAF
ncbi:MAG: glycosyltransferase family 4 protein, partial [Candidatus Uhrbacteria bacterium]|nr:glycosyltransferase family 4 protein [Candidatus Uhrbacteria bacterium]